MIISRREAMIILYLTEDGIVIKSDDPVIGNQGSNEIFLGSEYDYSCNPILPRVGDRLKYFIFHEDGEVSSRASDWVITRLEHLTRENVEDDKIAIAWCSKQPIKL